MRATYSYTSASSASDESQDAEPPKYAFITITDGGKPKDLESQTLIRKHVMRDIGKARRRNPPSKQKHIFLSTRKTETLPSRAKLVHNDMNSKDIECLWKDGSQSSDDEAALGNNAPSTTNQAHDRSLLSDHSHRTISTNPVTILGATFPFIKFPVAMNSHAYTLMHYIYGHPSPIFRPYRDLWVPTLITDEAAFLQVLSNVAPIVASICVGAVVNAHSIIHHSLAIQSVNSRLSDPVLGISDGIIGSILAFMCSSNKSGDFSTFASHFDGLQTIIQLRGGVEALDSNWALRMLLFNVDVFTAGTQSLKPRFPAPRSLLPDIDSVSQKSPTSSLALKMSILWKQTFPTHLELINILDDLAKVILIMRAKSADGQLWQDSRFAVLWISPIVHRLLSLAPNVEPNETAGTIQECCRLGAILFLGELRRKFGLYPIYLGRHVHQLKRVLSKHWTDWTPFGPLLLWVLVSGTIESSEGEERSWFVDSTAQVAHDLGLHSWKDIMAVLSKLLWLDEVFNVVCESFQGDIVERLQSFHQELWI